MQFYIAEMVIHRKVIACNLVPQFCLHFVPELEYESRAQESS